MYIQHMYLNNIIENLYVKESNIKHTITVTSWCV